MLAPGRLALVVVIVAALLLSGCSDRLTDRSEGQPSPRRLGGQEPTTVPPPQEAMSAMERTVAERLARHLGRNGLSLAHLDCPSWNDQTLPHRMTCLGYVEGLVAHVRVDLTATAGDHVSFDARVTDGIVAVGELERTLRRHGWGAADCGDADAYPARLGSRIRCRVTRSGRTRYVVATVEDRSGGVSIAADRGAPAG